MYQEIAVVTVIVSDIFILLSIKFCDHVRKTLFKQG